MSMTCFDIIKMVNMAVNRDVNSMAFTTDEYITMIHAQQIKLFKVKLGMPEQQNMMPGASLGPGSSKTVDADLNPFSRRESILLSSGILDYSTKNVAFITSIIPVPIVKRGIDIITPDEIGNRLMNPITKPTAEDPVAYEYGDRLLKIEPTMTSVVFHYYVYPTAPVFTITAQAETLQPVYTSTTELLWNDMCMVDIAYYVMRDAGLNVSKNDVISMSERIIESK